MAHQSGSVAQPPAKLRVLALHSFRTSAKIFKQQFHRAKLDAQLGDLVEVVFIDAPHPASGLVPRDVAPFFSPPYYEWFTAESMGDKVEFDEEKLLRSTQYVEAVLKEQGPFDGIVGFSQGSVMASSLVAMQHRGEALQGVPPLRFAVLFAGLKSRHPRHQACMNTKVQVPTIHLWGDRDQIKEHCVELADAFENAIVMTHARGHVIPALNPHQLAVLRAFLQSFAPAAGAPASSTPPMSKL